MSSLNLQNFKALVCLRSHVLSSFKLPKRSKSTARSSRVKDRVSSGDSDSFVINEVDRSPSATINLHSPCNAIFMALNCVAELPIPGIRTVVTALQDTLSHMQERKGNIDMMKTLTDRLDYLLKHLSHELSREATGMRLKIELQKLTSDLRTAQEQGWLQQFFDSSDNAANLSKHERALDSIIVDLATVVISETHQVTSETLHLTHKLTQSLQQTDTNQLHLNYAHADIDTTPYHTIADQIGTRECGAVASFNAGYQVHDFVGAKIRTGGGSVSSFNSSSPFQSAFEPRMATTLSKGLT